MITNLHASYGHYQSPKFFDLVKRYIYFPRLYEVCSQAARTCTFCQEINLNSNKIRPELKPRPQLNFGSTIIFDHLILPRQTKEGAIALFVLQEIYSGWVYIEPCRDLSAETTCKALIKRVLPDWVNISGLISDRHQTFKGKMMAYLANSLNIKHFFSSSLYPESHAKIERCILEVKRMIARYVDQDVNLESALPWIEMMLRIAPSRTEKISPFEICRGFKPCLRINANLIEQPLNANMNHRQFVQFLQHILQQIHAEVDKNVSTAQQKQKKAFDKRVRPKNEFFAIGDKVWLESLKPKGNSLTVLTHKKFIGPFVITAIVEKKSDFVRSEQQTHPNLNETSFGTAFQLTCCKSGRIWKSLIAHRRLKRYVGREDFDRLYPVRPTTDWLTSGGRLPTITENEDIEDSNDSNVKIQTSTDVKLCKSIVRQRMAKGALEFLVRYTDKSTAWLAAVLVADKLKAVFHVKQAQMKRRRQLAAKRIFKQGYLDENATRK